MIDRLDFSGGEVSAHLGAPSEQALQLELPAFVITGLGRDEGGVTPAAVAAEVTRELSAAILAEVARAGIERLVEDQKEKLGEKLGEKPGDLLKRD